MILSAVSPAHRKTTKTTLLLRVEDTMKPSNNANTEAYPGPKL